ncbi:hypothetical protein Glove_177g94 [Diversispora epigaea]|uniref:Deoxynucleoside kinase domain-containing protein n=1 Tax=Diversispora epigaea TaxID=1348612 RepID=A0A397INJ6_9GLOM|nr:hypothetical protein Glove_177g94 [Diversispora epigaea]
MSDLCIFALSIGFQFLFIRPMVLEETGIQFELEELEYIRTNYYYREKEWRIKVKDIQKEPVIDSLKDTFKGRQHDMKIIIIEGSCGAGKSTFVTKYKEYLTKYKKTVEISDKLFIIKDLSKRIINYGSNLKKYKEKEITKKQMEVFATELEEWIRDKWIKQIFEFYTRNRKSSILLMDRNLFSILIFMKSMEKERFFSKEKQKKVSTNYNNWSWLIRESLVIWWKTPVEETIKREVNVRNISKPKNELDIEQILFEYNDMSQTKRRKINEETIIGRYNLKKKNIRKKGEALELKALQILRAQNIITNMSKAHLLEETKEGTKTDNRRWRNRFIWRNNNSRTNYQWIGQCKITKQLTNTVINEMKGLLSTRPNTIGIIIYGESKSSQTEIMLETSNSDIFLSHIEELHTIRKQIEMKQLQKGIKTMFVTKMFIEEMEDIEFDKNGRILKAKQIKNISTQIWGTSSQNEDILLK